MLIALFLSSAHAACDPTALDPALDEVEAAYASSDAGRLRSARRAADKAARCGVLEAKQAARLLRAEALEAAVSNRWDEAESVLRSAVAAHPLLPLPDAIAPDQRFQLALARAQEADLTWRVSTTERINGVATRLRADARPYGSRSSAKLWTRVIGVGTAAVAGGLYGAAWVNRAQYDDRLAAGDNAAALKSYRSTNALSAASLGTGVVAIGVFGVSFAL
jgi:hypothetical protein